MAKAYTDNTNASDPPGSKRHNPSFDAESELPSEQGLDEASKKKRKTALGKRAAAKPAR